jgi:hypothetical protein
MKRIFVVSDVFRIGGKGLVLGGVNSELDQLTTEQFRDFAGPAVAVRSSTGSFSEYAVVAVQTSTSIIGKSNFFILLPEVVQESAIERGAVVFSLS